MGKDKDYDVYKEALHAATNEVRKSKRNFEICTSVQCSREKILVRYLYQKQSSRDQRGKDWGSKL